MGMMKEFREFALKGNVVDLAVGVIIGAAFGKIVSVLVDKVMMPPIGMITGGIDFSQQKLVIQDADPAAKKAEVAIGWGEFVNAAIYFLIVAFCLFLVIKAINTAKKRFEEQKPAPAPAGPTPDQKLLTEIRDLLAKR
ncbi:MAG: large-conductance mechanosensitive channel protein MscL [Phycisphaerales bacterium]|nr:large-conductance mechanosensitive channel protein MscL [Phycisphaerales bacterium]